MPGRKFKQTGSDYRYSINGQEKESELNENITTAQYWEYDSRIGRRWNMDPVENFALSPYATFENNPILFSDPFGDTTDKKKKKHGQTEMPTGESDKEIAAAYNIVKKRFDKKFTKKDISEELNQDATAWFMENFNPTKNKDYSKISPATIQKFIETVYGVWHLVFSMSFMEHFDAYDKIISSMSTDGGKTIALISLSYQDRKNTDFVTGVLPGVLLEYFATITFATYDIQGSTFSKIPSGIPFKLSHSSTLFDGIPAGAGKLLGARGEELTELMLRRAYPNATIAKQVVFKMNRYYKAVCDFVVMDKGKIIAVWESKVNQAIKTAPQDMLFLEKNAGVFTGKAAKQFGLEGLSLPEEALLREIRYNSSTGTGTIISHN